MDSGGNVSEPKLERMNRRRDPTDSLQIGSGATIPRSFAQAQGALPFFDALWRMKPDSSRILSSPEALDIIQRHRGVRGSEIDRINSPGAMRSRDDRSLYTTAEPEVADADRMAFIKRWQARFNLDDAWIGDCVSATMDIAWQEWMVHKVAYNKPLHFASSRNPDLHDGLIEPTGFDVATLSWTNHAPHQTIGRLVTVEDLLIPGILEDADGREWQDEGKIGEFDPRTEKSKEALKRMLPELEERLLGALERMAAEDREQNGARDPVHLKSSARWEWLVDFQVNRLSYADLTRKRLGSEEVSSGDIANVRSGVRQAAELIGLTLRRTSVGRPPKDRVRPETQY